MVHALGCSVGDVRLVGTSYSGRVEYCHSATGREEWIAVCGSNWTQAMSARVCAQVIRDLSTITLYEGKNVM